MSSKYKQYRDSDIRHARGIRRSSTMDTREKVAFTGRPSSKKNRQDFNQNWRNFIQGD